MHPHIRGSSFMPNLPHNINVKLYKVRPKAILKVLFWWTAIMLSWELQENLRIQSRKGERKSYKACKFELSSNNVEGKTTNLHSVRDSSEISFWILSFLSNYSNSIAIGFIIYISYFSARYYVGDGAFVLLPSRFK